MIRPNDLVHAAARPWFLAAVLSVSAGARFSSRNRPHPKIPALPTNPT